MRVRGLILLGLALWLVVACGIKPQATPTRAVREAPSHVVILPFIGNGLSALPTPVPTPDPLLGCFGDAQVVAFYRLLDGDSRQARPTLTCSPALVAAAKERAKTLSREGALSHCDQQGECANQVARRYGCILPASYAPNGNNIESLTAGTANAQVAFDSLANSYAHFVHLFARNHDGSVSPFFVQQTHVGIALEIAPTSYWGFYWVILIADCQAARTMIQYLYVREPIN